MNVFVIPNKFGDDGAEMFEVVRGGGAMAVWYQILDKMRDFATMTLPRRDRLRVESEVAFADTLGISCCQRESMFSGLMGRIIPRVERGSVEGEGVREYTTLTYQNYFRIGKIYY